VFGWIFRIWILRKIWGFITGSNRRGGNRRR
jgi:hypothetical protein